MNKQTVLITGANSGIGRATVLKYLSGNYNVIGHYNKSNDFLKEISNKDLFTIQGDLSSVLEIEQVFNYCIKKTDKLDVLINNAGTMHISDTIENISLESYEYVMDVNTRAPFILMQDSIKLMRRNKIKGTIANVLSMAAHSGMPFLTAYSSSKGALAIMIKNVANSVLSNQIRVNGLNIGWTDTPGEDVIQRKFHNGGEDWLENAEKKTAFKRLTKPIDVARGLAFLCSEESGLMTGSIIDFDQSVLGWHSYSAYDYEELSDSLIGD